MDDGSVLPPTGDQVETGDASREGAARAGQDLVTGSLLDDPSLLQDDDPVSEQQRVQRVVGHDEDGPVGEGRPQDLPDGGGDVRYLIGLGGPARIMDLADGASGSVAIGRIRAGRQKLSVTGSDGTEATLTFTINRCPAHAAVRVRFSRLRAPYRSVATWYIWRSLDPLPVDY